MDEFEQKTLKRKKSIFIEKVDFDEIIRQIRREALLEEEDIEAIHKERNSHKILRLQEYLMRCDKPDTFDRLCSILMRDYPWLAQEMQMEVKLERGDIELDPEVLQTSGMLVHRHFGSCARLCEADKKNIQRLLALRIQLAREEWKEERRELRLEIKGEVSERQQLEDKVRHIDKTVLEFLKKHYKQLTKNGHDMTTTSELLRSCPSDDDPVRVMEQRLKYLYAHVGQALTERDFIREERECSLKLLGMDDDETSRLDEILKGFSINKDGPSKVLRNWEHEVQGKEERITRLRQMNHDLEMELDASEHKAATCEIENTKNEARIKALEHQVAFLERQIRETPPPTPRRSGRTRSSSMLT